MQRVVPHGLTEHEFRQRMREWIRSHAPDGLRSEETTSERAAYRLWERRLLRAGLICATWPERYGGADLRPTFRLAFAEECARADVFQIERGLGERMVGPAVLEHGTRTQRDTFLPRIVAGEDVYCVAFSEPAHGSDLGSIETTGRIVGDEIVITGTKSWVRLPADATAVAVLCRSNLAAPRRQGVSYVLLRLDTDRITRRNVPQATDSSEISELRFDGARAPVGAVIGGVDNGWAPAMTSVNHERSAAANHVDMAREYWDLVDEARKSGRARDPVIREQLAWVYSRITALRTLSAQDTSTGPRSAVISLLHAEYRHRFGELAVDIAGPEALVHSPDRSDRWQRALLSGALARGTAEMQRNALAEHVLGLPKSG